MDIRRFFAVSSQGRSSLAKSSFTKDNVRNVKGKLKKRLTPVLSDSDSESPLPRFESTKLKKRVIDDDSENEEIGIGKTGSKKLKEEPNLRLTNADDFFGNASVRRKKSGNSKHETNAIKSEDAFNSSKEYDRSSLITKEIAKKVTKSKKSLKNNLQKETYENVSINEDSSIKELACSRIEFIVKAKKTEFTTPEKKCEKRKESDISPSQELKLSDDKNNSEKKRAHYLQYRQYLDRKGPQALGSKDIPEGRPDCLSGLMFVITGVLESFERDEIKKVIEGYKGKVTTSLSKNTSYLVIGREPGPAKVEKAKKLGTRILDENQLLELIAVTGKQSDYAKQETVSLYSGSKEKNFVINEVPIHQDKKSVFSSAEKTNTQQKKSKENNLSTVEFTNVTKRHINDKATHDGVSTAEQQLHKKVRKSLNNFISDVSKLNEAAHEVKYEVDGVEQFHRNESQLFKMWVDKYKPSTTKQIIGQQGDRSNVKKLQQWLLSWHKKHDDGKKPGTSKWYNKDDGASFKAVLLSGPPGVGKTTTAQLVCKECNFDYTELNASDTRSKKSLKDFVEGTVINKTLLNFACGKIQNGMSANHAVIMDEVDGMAGTQDRGGVQELIALIKSSKVPIICICNERSSPKIRSLSNYCYDLRFQKPRVEQIKSSMLSILYKENIQLTPNVLQDIIIASNQDIRQVLHNLSLWCAKKQLTADQAKCDIRKGIKNVNIGPFEAVRKVFTHSETQHMSIHDKSELFFTDYSFIPLFVQENYISVQPFEAKHNIAKHLQLLSGAADSICDGDLVEKHIRTNNNWSLLPVEAIYSSVIPGEIMSGSLTQMINFPSWLGKNSTVNHMKRILQQLHSHMRLKISSNKTDLHLDQLTVLKNEIVRPLLEREMDGIKESISILSNYCLLREDVDSIIELTHWPGKKNPMANISPKVKSAFTRTYNKEGIMNPYSITNIKKSRKREANIELSADDDMDDISDNGSDDNINTDAMVKVKKSAKKKIDVSVPKKRSRTKAK